MLLRRRKPPGEQILIAFDFVGAVTSGIVHSVEVIHNDTYNLPTLRWVEGAVSRCFCAEPLFFERNKDTFSQGPENLIQTPWAYRFHQAMSSTDGWHDGYFLTIFSLSRPGANMGLPYGMTGAWLI